ncbi:fam-a protein [Plasmodium chabaudi chabaudi]|uniref:Fam-a protein n=1 Tax=Plasmodium chabaudi chabaudi TaxID=31271 RepID=A0A4V0K4Q4_PLACU|nr:fam-a protein [Plasmodium chabaudi chabaudi]VTZ67848.1 fam-a protein [Plasmodium chabaudi chabaudi]|eukprot:XP_016652910.1 fam-a protein [Plasmodium chabaudi chabaudi]
MNSKYIKIVFLVIGLFAYASNNAFASESRPRKSVQKTSTRGRSASRSETSRNDGSASSDDNPNIKKGEYIIPICRNPEEVRKATRLMDDVIKRLEYHATNDGYDKAKQHDKHITKQYKNHADQGGVQKINIKIRGSQKYNDIIHMLSKRLPVLEFGDIRVKGRTIVKYSPDLVMIKQRYTNRARTMKAYFHALFAKIKISPNETIIAYASADVDGETDVIHKIDGNTSKDDDASSIAESYLSQAEDSLSIGDVPQEATIVEAQKQRVANVFGFIVKKEEHYVNVTHISSVNEQTPFSHNYAIQVIRTNRLAELMRLRDSYRWA